MNTTVQTAYASCGLGFLVFFIAGWWFIAGFVPAHPPLMDAQAIADSYRENTGLIRFGIMLAMAGVGFYLPFISAIGVQIRRTEGEFPILTFTQITSGTVAAMILLTCTVFWTAAAFRPERAAELIQLFNDIGWFFLLMTFSPFFAQLFSVGLAILGDK